MNSLAEESMSSPVEGIRRIIGEVVKFTMTDREMSDIVRLKLHCVHIVQQPYFVF